VLLVVDADQLCFACHGEGAMGSDLNVLSGTEEGSGGALRGGGFTTARIQSDDATPRTGGPPGDPVVGVLAAGEAVNSSHSVDSSHQTVWGFGTISGARNLGAADFPLSCGLCHDPHGSGNYRALRTIPSDLPNISTRAAVPDWFTKLWDDTNGDGRVSAGETVHLADENPQQYTTTDYWQLPYTDWWWDPDADDVATEKTGRRVGEWCTTCHTRYLAPAGAYKTDSTDEMFKFRHATDPSTRHTSATGPAIPQACLQCHVAHGSNATAATPMGLVDTSAHDLGTESSSNLLKMDGRGICQKCHNK
jgi:hypothetical protein